MKNQISLVTCLAVLFIAVAIADAQSTIWKVKTAGAMREMFETGNINGQTDIGKLAPQAGLFGLGPLAGLTGEIMIWDGVPLTSFMNGADVKVVENKEARAVFLVWTNVAKWKEFKVPATVRTYADLDKFIGETAATAKFSDVSVVPFLLKGEFEKVDWHVNDYKPDAGRLTHEKHDAAKIRRISANATLEMLGFYSTRHAGVFVHHTRSSHIHVTDSKRTFVGHVDELMTGAAVTLYLPIE